MRYYVRVYLKHLHRYENYEDLKLEEAQKVQVHHFKLGRFATIHQHK